MECYDIYNNNTENLFPYSCNATDTIKQMRFTGNRECEARITI